MHYIGGKFRLAARISSYLESIRNDRLFVEPFCGSCSVTSHMGGLRQASDVHEDLILMYWELQKGWEPPDIVTEQDYASLKNDDPSALRAFVGVGCSFSGKWFGGYARSGDRNYALNAKNSLIKLAPKIKGVVFKHSSYKRLSPKNSLIYCDPPYRCTTQNGYAQKIKFDSDEFWGIMRQWAGDNTVIVSEYSAPDFARCVAEFKTKTDMHCFNGKQERVERLFEVGA